MLELFSPLTTTPHDHHIINYESPDVSPSPLMTAIAPSHNMETWANFVFKDRFFICHKDPANGCQSYNVNNGSHIDHSAQTRTMSDLFINSATIGVNGKIWRVGGNRKIGPNLIITDETEFMDEDANWSAGPQLNEPRSKTTLVALSDFEIFMFGGIPDGIPSYRYNDQDQSLVAKSNIGDDSWSFMSAAYMTVPDLGKKVVLAILVTGEAITYDLEADSWTLRPNLDLPHQPADNISKRFGYLSPSQRYSKINDPS